jgi:hypothetical protein
MSHQLRLPETVREEIEDLRSYLSGLPSEWRDAGSFFAYEEKLRVLDQELALGRIAELASILSPQGKLRVAVDQSALPEDQMKLVSILEDSEQLYARSAASHAKRSQWLLHTILIASSATVASSLGLFSVLALPAAVTAAGAAAVMTFFRWSERSREAEKLADYLMAIRNEVMHLRYLPDLPDLKSGFRTSARVEALIAEVLSTKSGGPQRGTEDARSLR